MRRLLPLLLLLLTGGCSSSASENLPATDAAAEVTTDSGAEPASEAAVDAGACTLAKPYSSKDPACNACAAAECCAEVNGCLGDKRCDDDYVNCILVCALAPDEASDAGGCLADCASTHPEGKKLYDAAIGCVDAKCPTACK